MVSESGVIIYIVIYSYLTEFVDSVHGGIRTNVVFFEN